MIVLDLVQGTEAWNKARLGIPTASQFHRILTPKTLKPSASAGKYLCEKVVERWLGQSLDDGGSAFMARGSELERAAATAYEFEFDLDTAPVGFVLRDDLRVGCSPDRLVGARGLLEIKCLSAAAHVGALLGMADDEHRSQCQGQLWLTGRAWCDLVFYNPDMPRAIVRIERDPEYIAALAQAVDAFCDRLDDACERLNVRWQSPFTPETDQRKEA